MNVTLSLPDALMREFRVFAAAKNQSMTAIMAEAIRERMDREGADNLRRKANARLLARMRQAPDRGTGGKIAWTRGELYERVRRH